VAKASAAAIDGNLKKITCPLCEGTNHIVCLSLYVHDLDLFQISFLMTNLMYRVSTMKRSDVGDDKKHSNVSSGVEGLLRTVGVQIPA
jgi:hypothetical protein